jgi:PAS domain S-box-containing protein
MLESTGRNIDVAEPTPADVAVRWNEQRYRTLFDLGPVAVYSCDASGVIQEYNHRAAELWGCAPALGDTDKRFCGSFKLFRPDGTFMPHDECPMAEVVAGTLSEARDAEVIIERPDGSRITVVVNIRPVTNERGDVIGAINCFYDISSRKQTEEALRAREAELALVMSQTPFMLTRCTRELRYQFVSPTYADMMGCQPADIVGESIVEIMGQEAFETIRPFVETVLQGTSVEFECDIPYRRAGLRSVRGVYTPDTDERGHVRGWIASILDIGERKQVDAARALLASIVDSSDDAIVSKNLDGIITSWNAGAERIFGYAAAEVIGRSITIIIPADRRNEEIEIIRRLRQGQTIDHFETQRLTKDGRRVPISLTVSPVRNRQGVVVGASKIARDISDRVRADEERAHLLTSEQNARAEAETANRAKDLFLATVSHELRTPLNAILGWASMLEQGAPADSRMSKGLQSIHRNTRTLTQLVDDLLDVSRMISGKMRLDLVPMDLGDVIDAATEAVLPAASAKDIVVHVAVDPASRGMVGDPIRLQQAVWNLLSNAVKFTPAGGRVDVSTRVDGGEIELMVSDSGIGIDAAFLPYVFDRFRQADASSTRAQTGLGLGLAIVRHLVELHGGTVRAESDGPDAGTRFAIRLPRRHSPLIPRDSRKPAAASVAAATDAPRLDGLRILIVDDDRESCEMMLEALRGYGASILAAASASDAVDALSDFTPDLVLSDIAMPGRNGYAVLKEVRALEATLGRHLPVAAVTAYAHAADRERAIAAGFDEYLAKPVDPAALAFVVAALTAVHKR